MAARRLAHNTLSRSAGAARCYWGTKKWQDEMLEKQLRRQALARRVPIRTLDDASRSAVAALQLESWRDTYGSLASAEYLAELPQLIEAIVKHHEQVQAVPQRKPLHTGAD